MELLVASLVALALGPAAAALLASRRRFIAALDGFVLVAVVGLVVMHILPHALELGGWGALAAAAAGLFLPFLAERATFTRGSFDHHAWLVGLAMLGLAVHAMLDGAALSHHGPHHGEHGHPEGSLLALGVLFHRIPVGLVIWVAVKPRQGTRAAIMMLIGIAAATVIGFAVGTSSLAYLPLGWLGAFQALVAGTLFHVVFHDPLGAEDANAGTRGAAAVGGLFALGMLFALQMVHPIVHDLAGEDHVGAIFLDLALISAPPLLVAFVGAGLMRSLMRQRAVNWLSRGGSVGQALRGMAFGLPLPICSCGVVPLYRTLLSSGAPSTAAVAFLIATPELGLDALLLSLPLLGTDLAVARLACAALVAFTVAMLVGRALQRGTAEAATAAEPATPPPRVSIRAGMRFGFGELFDEIMPWVLAGLAIAAVADPLLDPAWIEAVPPAVRVPLFALVGLPVYVCASGATPIVAVLLANGLSPGAAIAFLLTGPATNVTTYGVLSSVHGKRGALLFGGATLGVAIGLGYLVDVIVPAAGGWTAGGSAHGHGWIAWSSLVVLTALVMASWVRQGPRGFMGQLLSDAELLHGHDHDHDHDHHGHGHDHGPDDEGPDGSATGCCD